MSGVYGNLSTPLPGTYTTPKALLSWQLIELFLGARVTHVLRKMSTLPWPGGQKLYTQ